MTTWEAYAGLVPIVVGKRRNGKPRTVLAINTVVVTTEADAKLVAKAHPSLKFVKREGSKVEP